MKFEVKQQEGLYTIPKWTKVAKTYNEALRKALKCLGDKRSLYNYRKGKLGPDRLRESEQKKKTMAILYKQKGDYISFKADLGIKYKGKSVEEVRRIMTPDEIPLGAYEVACILINHPEVLKKYDDIWLDCPGDEYDYPGYDVRFGHAPFFRFYGGGVGFGAGWVDGADGRYGSVSGLVSQSLKSGKIETFDDSILERLDSLEVFKAKVEKVINL